MTVDRTQIPIVDTSHEPETKAKTVIRRIKQTVTRDMLDSLKETLSNETRKDVESLGRAVASAQGTHRANGEAVGREISIEVDNLLAKAWEITLREVGETVTIRGTHPVKGRSNQSGHLRNTNKRTYKQLLTHLRKVRVTIKAVNRSTHSTPKAERIAEIHKILRKPPPTDDTTPADAWEELQRNLSDTRTSLKQVLT